MPSTTDVRDLGGRDFNNSQTDLHESEFPVPYACTRPWREEPWPPADAAAIDQQPTGRRLDEGGTAECDSPMVGTLVMGDCAARSYNPLIQLPFSLVHVHGIDRD